MHYAFTSLAIVSAASFLCYGFSCLRSVHMRQEFARFGLARYRPLAGRLQLAGAIGLLVGLWVPGVGFLSAAGLSLLMLLGFGVRVKIRDRLVQALPALIYMLLNLYLSVGYAGKL